MKMRYVREPIGLCSLALVIAGALVSLLATPGWTLHLGTATRGHVTGEAQRKAEDVRNTLHNLGDSILGFDNPNILAGGSSNREVCVFCHTPHGANPNVPGAAPLWNRQVNTTGYTTYSAPNMDTTPGQPVGVSLACLSCHDGTIAVDALVNMPGSGGFRGLTPASADLVNAEGTTTLIDSTTGKMKAGLRGTAGEANYDPFPAGTTGAEPFPNLTQNLSDDHPISMLMPVSTDPQFAAITFVQAGQVGLISRGTLVNPADRRDSVRTYPASGGGTWTSPGWIECASCHNPHAPRPLFLRLPNHTTAIPSGGGAVTVGTVLGIADPTLIADNPNAGSAICLSCHEK